MDICKAPLNIDAFSQALGYGNTQFYLQTSHACLHSSVVTVSKCFLLVGFRRFCRKNLGFRFGLGFHDKRVVNFFMTMIVRHDFHHS